LLHLHFHRFRLIREFIFHLFGFICCGCVDQRYIHAFPSISLQDKQTSALIDTLFVSNENSQAVRQSGISHESKHKLEGIGISNEIHTLIENDRWREADLS
jgi:hypothetical protein